jgi:hypothetical protein
LIDVLPQAGILAPAEETAHAAKIAIDECTRRGIARNLSVVDAVAVTEPAPTWSGSHK